MFVYGAKGRKNPYSNPFVTYSKFLHLILVKKIVITKDIAYNFQFGFQDVGSSLFECIIDLHHDIMFLLLFIIFFVALIITIIVNINKKSYVFFNNNFFLFSFKKDYKTKLYFKKQ